MKRKELSFLVVIETTVIGLVAMGIFGLLLDRYEHAEDAIAQQTAASEATEFFIAMLTMTPPTTTPSTTPTWTQTPLPTRTASPTVSTTPRPSVTRTKTPLPTRTPAPTAVVTPKPTLAPATAVAQCDTLDSSGTYRLTADLVSNGECLKVQASYVVLDCAGHAIRGTNFSGYGVGIHKYGLLNTQSPGYVEVRNCRVSNFAYGIYADSGNHLIIHDNNSSNNYDDTDPATRFGKFLGMVDGGGIRLSNVTDSQIYGNTTTNQAIGIDVRYSSGVVVRGNTSSNNSAWGINLVRTQNSQASNNTTADNVRKCTWGAGSVGWGCDAGGIAVQDGSNGNLIANNTITGRNGNGVFIKAHAMPCGSNNSIMGNTISSVLYNGVELGFCTGNKVDNNQIRGGLDGVWMGFAHNNEINGNLIMNMSNHGIISSNSHDNTISGNQVVSSNEGAYFYSEDYSSGSYSWLPAGDYKSHNNCLCGNTFQSNTVAVHLQDSTGNQVTNNLYVSNGRTFLVQGNGDGNNLQGYGRWWPWPLGVSLAWK